MDWNEKFGEIVISDKQGGIEDGDEVATEKNFDSPEGLTTEPAAVQEEDEDSEEDDWEASIPISAPKQVDFDESNALEIWNFPSFFTKKDLDSLFGLSIKVKWIDNTAAVIHFENPQDMKRGYLQLSGHPTIKHKVYTPMEKRDRSSRPTTTDMVARRMIAGALGMKSKLKKTAAEIESDSEKLRLVREEKEKAIKKKADEKDQRLRESNKIFDS